MIMRVYVWLADLLTLFRLFISPVLVYLGYRYGAPVLPQAVLLVLLGWVADGLDGPVARMNKGNARTRLGRYDFAVDVLLTWATFAYLTLAGFIPWPLALLYTLLAMAVVAYFQRKSVVIAFMRPIDVTGGLIALRYAPEVTLLLVAWLVGMAIVQWRRVRQGVPAWLRDLYLTTLGRWQRCRSRDDQTEDTL